jgi:hypothetical protein
MLNFVGQDRSKDAICDLDVRVHQVHRHRFIIRVCIQMQPRLSYSDLFPTLAWIESIGRSQLDEPGKTAGPL